MPIYEYKCENCGNEFEEMLHFSERDVPLNTPCPFPTCGGKVHLKMSMSSFQLKGLGWFDVSVFKLYYKEKFSLNSMSRATKINRSTLGKSIRFIKNFLKNEKEN